MNLKRRILIADDEKALIQTMAFTLKRNGYDVKTEVDGWSAFASIVSANLSDAPFDLLITDIQMPGLSGLELILKLREAEILIPILVITGYGNMELVVKLLRAGCMDYLDKPFEVQDLLDRVSHLLN